MEEYKMKDYWKSKTLWINIIAIACIIVRAELGYVLSPEAEIMILGAINLILRMVTKEELNW